MRAIKAGADDFLTKPVKADDLLPAIERAFARHQTSRDLQNKLEVVRARIGTLTPREQPASDNLRLSVTTGEEAMIRPTVVVFALCVVSSAQSMPTSHSILRRVAVMGRSPPQYCDHNDRAFAYWAPKQTR